MGGSKVQVKKIILYVGYVSVAVVFAISIMLLFYSRNKNETGKAIADLIAFYDEEIDCTKDLTIYHQSDIWKFKTIEANTYTVEELQVPIFEDGKFVYQELSVKEIRDYSMQEKARLWDEIFRLEFPHNYYVDLTKNLLDFKIKMLEEKRK